MVIFRPPPSGFAGAFPAQRPRVVVQPGSLVAFTRWVFTCVVILYFVFSPSLLYVIGWYYLGGGFGFQKIHLATYLLFPTFIFLFFSDRLFQRRAIAVGFEPSFLFFVIAVCIVSIYATVFKRVPIAPFVDTFFAAIIITVGLIALPRHNLLLLRRMIDIFFVIGIAVLFYEYLYTMRILPTATGEAPLIEHFFRSSAIFEGPLSAATLLGLYSLINLIVNPIRFSFGSLARLILSFTAFAAIFTTGGRAALVSCTVIFVLLWLAFIVQQVKSQRINVAALLYACIGVPLIAAMLAVLSDYGIFDTTLARFIDDAGSALSREIALNMVLEMSGWDYWFGMSPSDFAAAEARQIELIAIEISWANFILVCGLPLTIILFVAFLLFLFRFLPKICGISTGFCSLFLLLNVSASNGIWAKTTILTSSLAMFLAYLRRDPAEPK